MDHDTYYIRCRVDSVDSRTIVDYPEVYDTYRDVLSEMLKIRKGLIDNGFDVEVIGTTVYFTGFEADGKYEVMTIPAYAPTIYPPAVPAPY